MDYSPWGTDQGTLMNQGLALSGQIGDMQSQYQQGMAQPAGGSNNAGQGQAGGYPTYANPYGIGTGTFGNAGNAPPQQATPGTASNPGYLQNSLTQTATDSSSRGFNPWSLQGESNARGK